MKRAVFLHLLLCSCLIAEGMAFGQSEAQPAVKKTCSFSIIGIWKSAATTATNPFFYSFSSDGWVRLLGHTADTLPQDFEMIAEMKYTLDNPAQPKRLELMAMGGNEIFPAGMTAMKIAEYSDDSFVTINLQSGERTQWFREPSHRYFLTFVTRTGPTPYGGPAFVMWTMLDGRKTSVEALGLQLLTDQEGKIQPDFGPIPSELYDRLLEESDRDKKSIEYVMMRLELTPAEFATTHQIYELWSKQAKRRTLPYADANLNAFEFLKKVAESLNNQCGEKVKLLKLTERERDERVSQHKLPEYMVEYIRAMRRKNDELHINDAVFPWQWRPMIQVPGQ